jgi:FkbM family methyltransferase
MLPKANKNDKIRIVDCGANIGMSLLFFKKFFPNAEIIAFEPDEASFKLLEKNINENNLSHVKIFRNAVGNKNGKLKLYTPGGFDGSPGSSIYRDLTHSKTFMESEIEMIPLSGLKLGKIDVLKIDIEGAEEKVFQDLVKNNILKKVGLINLEYHHGSMLKDNRLSSILKAIEDAGFEYLLNPDSLMNDKVNSEEFKRIGMYVLILNGFRE